MAKPPEDRTTACPACTSIGLASFVSLHSLPVLCNSLWPEIEQAMAAPTGDIELAFCPSCGLITNLAFDAGLVGYNPSYENSLHFSSVFQDFARGLAQRLIQTYGIRGKTVVEIGSGKGDFLTMVCEAGDNDGIGYDPSYAEESFAHTTNARVRFVPALWDGRVASADLVCCRQVLEHVEDPNRMVADLHSALAGQSAVVYFEVPDAAYMLRTNAVYDVIYEHCSYFSAPPLSRLFSEAGFRVLRVGTSFGGQYLHLEATPHATGGDGDGDDAGTATLDELAGLVRSFDDHLRASVDAWGRRLTDLHAAGRDVVAWGAGSKGVTFLNMVAGGKAVSRIVDVNPRKRGRFVPVSGQQVVAPADLVRSPPHTVIVMNPLYLEEIRAQLAALDLFPDVVGV